MTIKLTLKGEKQLIRKLNALKGGSQRRAVRGAGRKAMSVVNKQAKKEAPVKTKQLKKSIGIKAKTFSRKGVVWVGVSARRGFKSKQSKRNPTKYLHLILLGFRHVRSGKQIDENDFMTEAFNKTRAKAQAIFVKEMRIQIERLARKR